MPENANLQLEYRGDCLIIQVHGRDIIDRMEETVQAIAAAIRSRPVRATLVDLTAVPGLFQFMDRYKLGETAGRRLAGLVVAALAHEEQTDPQRIGKLTARNRGVQLEVFTDPAEAEAWLKKFAAPVQPG